MRRRELIAICCVAALGLAMTGCNSTTAGTDTAVSDSEETASTSVSGRITDIDGTQVTVRTGGQNQNTPPEKPERPGRLISQPARFIRMERKLPSRICRRMIKLPSHWIRMIPC